MSYGIAYYILLLMWLVFGIWQAFPTPNAKNIGGNILLFILFILIGLQIFGKPLHG